MKVPIRDVVTAPNFLTIVGLFLTIFGTFNLDRVNGFLLVFCGRMLDILDGAVARRTHTSLFGARLDAFADKLSGLFVLAGAYQFKLAPALFLLFLFIQHFFVVIVSLVSVVKKLRLDVLDIGKYNMFLHITTLLCYCAVNLTRPTFASQLLRGLAVILTMASILTGLAATLSYVKLYNKIRTT